MTNRLTSPLKRAERTCALVGSAGNPEIELDLIEWDYDDLTSERCASAIVSVRKPGAMRFSHRRSAEARSDALQPSSQCGSPGAMRFSHRCSAEAPERCASAIVTVRKPGAMRFSHRYSAEARSDALQPSFHPSQIFKGKEHQSDPFDNPWAALILPRQSR